MNIPARYSPFWHILVNFGLLISLVLLGRYHSRPLFVAWPWLFLLLLPGILILGNLVVYWIHRCPLHHRWPFWAYPYQAHTVEHHTSFTSERPSFQSFRELYAILFPQTVVVSFALGIMPLLGWGIYVVLVKFHVAHPHAWAWCVMGLCAFYFLLYEILHTTSHLPDGHLLLRIRYLKFMQEHHRLHHDPKLMGSKNFGIVFPFMDWIFKTKA